MKKLDLTDILKKYTVKFDDEGFTESFSIKDVEEYTNYLKKVNLKNNF
jgi:hypothetical protein